MNGFEKRAALIKDKILNTTLEMLKTLEPSNLRIADIAKAAQVSQVTIYNYFGGKEALIHEVVKNYIDSSISDFQKYMQQDGTVKEKIERMILQDKEAYHTLSPFLINQLLTEDKELAEYVQKETNEKIIPSMIKLIEDGKENGEISEKVTTQAFLVFINFYLKHYQELVEMVNQENNTDLIESMHHIFFYGICGKEE
ncbi:TetR/AcrR family transcriptional regulator [Rummeliibacillus sp. NPDC094406]|uniref:TetR/AcrR family transcriptional regulator n=1 Tax=Rummeliibacillus sp. NPDC094406 TaxID=3364511 RepID=UPI0038292B1C